MSAGSISSRRLGSRMRERRLLLHRQGRRVVHVAEVEVEAFECEAIVRELDVEASVGLAPLAQLLVDGVLVEIVRHPNAQRSARRQHPHALERLRQIEVRVVRPLVEERVDYEQLDALVAQLVDEGLGLRRQLGDVAEVHHAAAGGAEEEAQADVVRAVPHGQGDHRQSRHGLERSRPAPDGRAHGSELELGHPPLDVRLGVGLLPLGAKVRERARHGAHRMFAPPHRRRANELGLLGVVLHLHCPLHQADVVQPHHGVCMLMGEHDCVEAVDAVLGIPPQH
mmetsp:Transcript_5653/g.22304  ORF Transcript_5653/g.22304 Transcript_5653/m.22304 type:complete len:282 (+) Transcript_5653:1549-2394(+)